MTRLSSLPWSIALAALVCLTNQSWSQSDPLYLLSHPDDTENLLPPLDEDYLVRSYTVVDGLRRNRIDDIAQTSDGFIWLVTTSGLIRFDGLNFDHLRPTSIGLREPRHFISLHVAPQSSTVWATHDTGIWKIEGTEIREFLVPPSEFGDSRLWQVDQIPGQAALIIRFADDFLRFDGQRFHRLGWLSTLDEPRLLTATPSQELVIGDRSGLWKINTQHESKEPLLTTQQAHWGHPYRLLETNDKTRWIATSSRLIRDGPDDIDELLKIKNPFIGPTPQFLKEGVDGTIWLGVSNAGVVQVRPKNSEPVREFHQLKQMMVSCGLTTPDGHLWIGTARHGLIHVQPRRIDGIQSAKPRLGPTNSIVESPSGELAVASHKGLFLGNKDQLKVLPPDGRIGQLRDPSEYFNVRHLAYDKKQRLWYANSDHSGVLINGVFCRLVSDKDTYPFRRGVNVILPAQDGHIYLGTGDGIIELAEKNFSINPRRGLDTHFGRLQIRDTPTIIQLTSDRSDDNIRFLHEDSSAQIWARSRYHGVFRRAKNREWTLVYDERPEGSPQASCWLEDSRGLIWLGTTDGLIHLPGNGPQWHFRGNGDYSDIEVNSIVEDDYEHFWLGTNQGLMRLDRNDLVSTMTGELPISNVHIALFDERDGMPATETTSGYGQSAYKSPNGRIFFGTIDGVAAIDSRKFATLRKRPKPVITSCQVDAQESFLQWTTREGTIDRVNVAPGSGHTIRIQFTAAEFSNSDQCRFAFKLEGLDPAWSPFTRAREAEYRGLRPGDYDFLVRARNATGEYSEATASLRLSIAPLFYQRTAFQVFVACLAIALIYLVYRIRLAGHVRESHLRHELKLSSERDRIARDIHDDLGTDLTQISHLCRMGMRTQSTDREVALEKIDTRIRQMIESMGEIIWATSTDFDTVAAFAAHFRNNANEIINDTDLSLTFDNRVEHINDRMSARHRRELLLTCKEAIHNAIKHAKASQIYILISMKNHSLTIRISDDGVGINPKLPQGNGTRNMIRRISALGGQLLIDRLQPTGTRITIQAPINTTNPY